jgi:predicted metal-dependent peptidase
MNIEDRIVKAKIKLHKKNPFFSYLVLHLNFIHDEKINTIGVNCKGDVHYSEKFLNSLDDDELMAMICHETTHIIFNHLIRRKNYNTEIWNIATDIITNQILLDNDFKLHKSGIIPHNNRVDIYGVKIDDIRGKTSEEIYEIMDNNVQKIEIKQCIGIDVHILGDKDSDNFADSDKNNKCNKTCSVKKNSIEENPEQKNEEIEKNSGNFPENDKIPNWERVLTEAVQYAKNQGNEPHGIDRYVDSLLNPVENWRSILYKHIIKEIPYDYNFSLPSRRSQSIGVYLPRIKKETIDIFIAIDTSGSISETELKEFLTEISEIIKSFVNIRITIMSCDYKIHEIYEFTSLNAYDLLKLNLKGRGGTSFQEPINYIRENKPHARLLIYFTDGYGDKPNLDNIAFKILWIITKHGTIDRIKSCGEIINLS